MVNNCCEFNKNPEFSSEYSSKGSFFGRNCFQISNISNLFYTGQLTVPGPGVPPSLISGQIVADYILKHKS